MTGAIRDRSVPISSLVTVAIISSILLSTATRVHGQPIGSMAPITFDARDVADASSVFNWREVPADQDVTLTRATFDEGGYQLYDTVGETVVVPFTDHNLYVMKFARSHNGSMYFVNTGSTPILFVPPGGYLVNATDPSARWYPFSPRFHPSTPVYIGIAPSWHAFIGMGWYPHMAYYGGYWCDRPVAYAGIFIAMAGLSIFIGTSYCDGWWPYYHYCSYHRPPYRVAYWNHDVYRWAERPEYGHREFGYRHFDRPFGRPGDWEHRSFSGRAIPRGHMPQLREGQGHFAAVAKHRGSGNHFGGGHAGGGAKHWTRGNHFAGGHPGGGARHWNGGGHGHGARGHVGGGHPGGGARHWGGGNHFGGGHAGGGARHWNGNNHGGGGHPGGHGGGGGDHHHDH